MGAASRSDGLARPGIERDVSTSSLLDLTGLGFAVVENPFRQALLVSDPRAARQFGAFGSLLLWRDAQGEGPRRGLLCVPDVCTSPACLAVHIWLGKVDATMASVSMSGTAFEFVLDADRFGNDARMPLSDAFANYDTEAGSLKPTEGHEKSPLVKWLLASADADVLAHLRTPLMRREFAAGRIMKRSSNG